MKSNLAPGWSLYFEMDSKQENPYRSRAVQWLSGFEVDLWNNLDRIPGLPEDKSDEILAGLIEMACKCQHIANITLGREQILSLPRQWAIDNINSAVDTMLDLNDEWEFQRLLEVYQKLDKGLLDGLISRGLKSENAEINQAALELQSQIDGR